MVEVVGSKCSEYKDVCGIYEKYGVSYDSFNDSITYPKYYRLGLKIKNEGRLVRNLKSNHKFFFNFEYAQFDIKCLKFL